MWHLGTWFSGGLGNVRLTVGLDDLKGLFQSKRFYDSSRDGLEYLVPFWPPMFEEEEPQTTAGAETTYEENKGDSSWEWSHAGG